MTVDRYSLTVVTPPASEPLSLDEAKAHLRVEHTADDDYLSALIAAARVWCEAETQRTFVTTALKLMFDEFPDGAGWPGDWAAIRLRSGPVASVETVKYYATGGTLTTLDSSLYQTWLATEPPMIVPAVATCWPLTQCGRIGAVEVNYTAGYGDASAVPQPIKQAMKVLMGQRYEQRGDDQVLTLERAAAVHPAVYALLAPYRTRMYS